MGMITREKKCRREKENCWRTLSTWMGKQSSAQLQGVALDRRGVWVGVLVAQLCSTLQPTESSPPGSPVHGSLQASMLQWVAMPFSKGSSWPRDQTWVSSIAGRFFTIWTTGGPTIYSQFQERKQIFEHWCWQASGCGGSCGCSLLCKVGSKIVIKGVRRRWRVEERGKGMKSLSRKSRELTGTYWDFSKGLFGVGVVNLQWVGVGFSTVTFSCWVWHRKWVGFKWGWSLNKKYNGRRSE